MFVFGVFIAILRRYRVKWIWVTDYTMDMVIVVRYHTEQKKYNYNRQILWYMELNKKSLFGVDSLTALGETDRQISV